MPGYDQSVSEGFITITPNDTTPLSIRGFHCGTGGTVAAVDASGRSVLFKNCVSGLTYGYACRKILFTGTTAADIVGLV